MCTYSGIVSSIKLSENKKKTSTDDQRSFENLGLCDSIKKKAISVFKFYHSNMVS